MCLYRPALLGLVVLFFLAEPAAGRDRQAAREAFARARAYHQEFLRLPPGERTPRQYNRAIFLYRRVIDFDPTYGAADDSIYAMASLYDEMAGRFGDASHRRRAIYYYEFVADQYPLTKHRGPALERAASLRSLDEPRAPSRAQGQIGTAPAAPEAAPEPSRLATVSNIRYWSSHDYTRVVIHTDREVSFEKEVLEAPDRLYFDLQDARLSPELVGRTYEVNDVFIKQIRVAQHTSGVVRVVLDFESIHRHSVFALYDPFRIVIDTLGPPETQVARAGPVEGEAAAPPPARSNPTVERPPAAAPPAALPPAPAPAPAPAGAAATATGDLSLTRTLGLKVGRVVLDPGHGGRDTGTIGPTGLREKDVVLSVALRLKKLLEERLGTEVILTRERDVFVPLEERTAIANQYGADLFVSIHANASRNRAAFGVETFFLNFASGAEEREVAARENAASQKTIRELEDLLRQIALGEYNQESRELAQVVQERLYLGTRRHRTVSKDRGVKTAPFIVLIGSNMPSILTEIGFLSNPTDEAYLKGEKGQEQVAEALYSGIEEYFRALGALPLGERVAGSQ